MYRPQAARPGQGVLEAQPTDNRYMRVVIRRTQATLLAANHACRLRPVGLEDEAVLTASP